MYYEHARGMLGLLVWDSSSLSGCELVGVTALYWWGGTGGTGFVKEAGWEEGSGCMGQLGRWEGCCLNNSAEVTHLMHA